MNLIHELWLNDYVAMWTGSPINSTRGRMTMSGSKVEGWENAGDRDQQRGRGKVLVH